MKVFCLREERASDCVGAPRVHIYTGRNNASSWLKSSCAFYFRVVLVSTKLCAWVMMAAEELRISHLRDDDRFLRQTLTRTPRMPARWLKHLRTCNSENNSNDLRSNPRARTLTQTRIKYLSFSIMFPKWQVRQKEFLAKEIKLSSFPTLFAAFINNSPVWILIILLSWIIFNLARGKWIYIYFF